MKRSTILRAGLVFTLVCCFLSSLLLSPFIPSAHAAAVSKNPLDYGLAVDAGGHAIINSGSFIITWVDAATINISPASDPSIVLVAKPKGGCDDYGALHCERSDDGTADYVIQGWSPLNGTIKFPGEKPDQQVTSLTLDIDFYDPVKGDINGPVNASPAGDIKFNTQSPELSTSYFSWTSKSTIDRVDGKASFVQDPAHPEIFLKQGDGEGACQDRLVVSADLATVKYYELDNDFNGDTAKDAPGAITPCHYHNKDDGNYAFPHSNVQFVLAGQNLKDQDTPTPIGDESGSGGSAPPTCESNADIQFAWAICPILRGIDHVLNAIDNEVQAILRIDSTKLDNGKVVPNEQTEIRQAWVAIRNMSTVLLVIIALVMVVSTALGSNMFDAYTVRKVLPRLVAAVILMQISFALMKLAIDITNDIGDGIQSLMIAPFKGLDPNLGLATIFSNSSSNIGGAGTFEGIATVGAIGVGLSLGLLGILSLALTTAVGVFMGFAVLLLRNIIILMTIVLAPLAIVAYILPGTEKAGKFWWDAFSKGLMMYPIIMVMFATGKIFAYLAANNQGLTDNGGLGTISLIFALAGYVIPFFLIPATLRFAGGALSSLGGMVNDRSKGFFDRNKKFRGRKVTENNARMKAGNRFEGTMPGTRMLSRGFNRTSVGLGTGIKGRFGLPTTRGRAAVDQVSRNAATEQVMKGPNWAAVNQDDNALMAATYENAHQAQIAMTARFNGDEDRARAAVAAVQASIGFGKPQAIAAAQQLVATGTGYNNLQDMTQTLARVSGGNVGTASALAGFANSQTKGVGRADLAPGFGNLNTLVQNQMTGNAAANNYDAATREAWQSVGLGQIVTGKPVQTEAFADFHLDRLQNGNQVEKREAAIALMELQNSLPSASGGNQRVINRTMHRLRNEAGTRLGLDFNAINPATGASYATEDQLAIVATHPTNATPAVDFDGNALTGSAIRGMARVYDQSVPMGARGGTPPPTGTPPPGGGTGGPGPGP